MSRLWNWVDSRKYSNEGKIRVFLFFNCLIYSVFGFLLWLIVSRFTLDTLDWALCFAGYPGLFIGFIGGYIFLCRQ